VNQLNHCLSKSTGPIYQWTIAISILVGLFFLSNPQTAHAQSAQTWYLQNVTFNTGTVAYGSFKSDASTNTYSDVNITVVNGPSNGTNRYGDVHPNSPGNEKFFNTVVQASADMMGGKTLQFTLAAAVTSVGGKNDMCPVYHRIEASALTRCASR